MEMLTKSKSVTVINVKKKGGTYAASCSEYAIEPEESSGLLTFVINTHGWTFAIGATPPAPYSAYRSPPSGGADCGIWIEDITGFSCSSNSAKQVKLKKVEPASGEGREYHYIALLTNGVAGSEPVVLDPIIRDRGN